MFAKISERIRNIGVLTSPKPIDSLRPPLRSLRVFWAVVAMGCIVILMLCLFSRNFIENPFARSGLAAVSLAAVGAVLAAMIAFARRETMVNVTLAVVVSMACLGAFELVLRFSPGRVIFSEEQVNFLPAEAKFRAIQTLRPDQFETWQEELVFDGLFYRFKPFAEISSEALPSKKPFIIRIDENGFRNPRGTADKPLQIVFLGDSGLIGVGARQNFSSLIGRSLQTEVMNLGMGGYGPWHHLQVLERYGADKKPKVVVIVMFNNDFDNATTFSRLVEAGIDDGRRYLTKTSPGSGETETLKRFVSQYCAVCTYGYGLLRIPMLQETVKGTDSPVDFKPAIRPSVQEVTELTLALTAIRSRVTEWGGHVLLTYIPEPVEIYAGLDEEISVAQIDEITRRSDAQGIGNILASTADRLGINFFDPRPGLQLAARDVMLYAQLNDPHFNEFGHRAFAELLGPEVQRLSSEWIETHPPGGN